MPDHAAADRGQPQLSLRHGKRGRAEHGKPGGAGDGIEHRLRAEARVAAPQIRRAAPLIERGGTQARERAPHAFPIDLEAECIAVGSAGRWLEAMDREVLPGRSQAMTPSPAEQGLLCCSPRSRPQCPPRARSRSRGPGPSVGVRGGPAPGAGGAEDRSPTGRDARPRRRPGSWRSTRWAAAAQPVDSRLPLGRHRKGWSCSARLSTSARIWRRSGGSEHAPPPSSRASERSGCRTGAPT